MSFANGDLSLTADVNKTTRRTPIDPRAQIVAYVSFTTSVFLTNSWIVTLLLGLCAALLLFVLRINWRATRTAWLWLLLFIAFTVITSTIDWNTDRVLNATMRLVAVFFATILISNTFDHELWGVAFHGLGFSDRLSFVAQLTIRYVPMLIHDFEVTREAQMTRGLGLDDRPKRLMTRIRRFAPLIVPTIARSYSEADDVADAMDLRGFGAVSNRSWCRSLRFAPVDYLTALTSIAGLLVALSWRLST